MKREKIRVSSEVCVEQVQCACGGKDFTILGYSERASGEVWQCKKCHKKYILHR